MIYCGIDGGGTKTKIIIANETKVLYEVVTGPTSIDTVSIDETRNNIEKALESIYNKVDIPKIDSIFMGIGGIASDEDSLKVHNAVRSLPYFSKDVVIKSSNDIRNAYLASCSGRFNITIIVGTGAVAYGEDEQGNSHRTNGIHYLEGDFGSAYDVGVRAIKAMTLSFDGRIETTPFTTELLETSNISSLNDLIHFLNSKRMDRTYVAQFAKIVTKHARMNDEHALKIIDEATDEMLRSIIGVDQKIDLKNREIGVVGSLGNSEVYFKELRSKINKYDSSFIIHISELDPVRGSLIEARNQTKIKYEQKKSTT